MIKVSWDQEFKRVYRPHDPSRDLRGRQPLRDRPGREHAPSGSDPPVEEAEGLQALMTEQKYTQEQLGGIIGKAQNTLSEILSLNKLPQDVRDDCRGDRTISKNALITIAKKKQARSMTTAYIAYKAKLQKGNPPRQKKDPNEPQAVFDMMDKSMTKIRSIDTSAWTDDDNTNFQTSLISLKTEIDNYLNAPPASKNLA